MGRFAFLATVFMTALVLVLPFVGGGGPGLQASVAENSGSSVSLSTSITGPQSSLAVDRTLSFSVTPAPVVESAPSAEAVSDSAPDVAESAPQTDGFVDTDFAVASTAPDAVDLETAPGVVKTNTNNGCPKLGAVTVGTAPSKKSAGGVPGTTSDDLRTFAAQFNAIRIANCLPPITKFTYDSCMEARLFWMAESPSPDPLDAWGHIGSKRIDGVPSVGCDGNLAGGSKNTGATVAQKWWDSAPHRASLYRPGSSVTGVCIALAMTHGGNGEPYSFTRAAARWTTC